MHNNVKWPALLILEHDDLLYYLSSAEDLSKQLENHFLSHTDTCTVLDHTGQQFNLSLTQKQTLTSPYSLQSLKNLELSEFNQMVRNHLSARQQCCVLKIVISSFEQGFKLVLDTTEE